MPIVSGDVAEHTHFASGSHRRHAAARHGERDTVAQLPVHLMHLLLYANDLRTKAGRDALKLEN